MHPKYIDIHSHVNFSVFDEDRADVMTRALDSNTWVINVGTQLDTSKKAVELAHKYSEGVFAIVGLHPIHTEASFHDREELGEEGREFVSRGEVFDKDAYRELLKDPKVLGVGECGLDYYHLDEDSLSKQKETFSEQIELANEFNKPLMIHVRNNYEDNTRNAYKDVFTLLKEKAKVKGVVHFFEGDMQDMQNFISIGFKVSFTGAITYPPRKNKRNCEYENIIREIPLDMILADTDSPYMAPVPFRGKRNEPVYIKEIVKKIAEIKGISEDEIASHIFKNARDLFGF